MVEVEADFVREIGQFFGGGAQTFNNSQNSNAFWANSRVKGGDSTAHGVAKENHVIQIQLVEQAIKIGQIVGEVIIAARGCMVAFAVPSGIRCDEVVALGSDVFRYFGPGCALVEVAM